MAQTLAQRFSLPLLDLDCLEVETLPTHRVNEALIRRHSVLPLSCRGNHLYLATEDPGQQSALKEIQFQTGLHTYAIVVETDKLYTLIERVLTTKEKQSLAELVDDATAIDQFVNHDEEHASPSITEDAPIVKLVNKIDGRAIS